MKGEKRMFLQAGTSEAKKIINQRFLLIDELK